MRTVGAKDREHRHPGLDTAWHSSPNPGHSVQVLSKVPDMPNIRNMLTIIGQRFGSQSGPDESSARNSTTFLHGIAFRVYLVISKIRKNTKRATHIKQKLPYLGKLNCC